MKNFKLYPTQLFIQLMMLVAGIAGIVVCVRYHVPAELVVLIVGPLIAGGQQMLPGAERKKTGITLEPPPGTVIPPSLAVLVRNLVETHSVPPPPVVITTNPEVPKDTHE